MKNFGWMIVPLLLALVPALAGASSDPNQIGFYFEPGAESNCLETSPYVTVPLYLVLTEPDFDALYGYEYSFSADGSYLIQAVQSAGTGPIDVGGSTENHMVGLATPLRVSGPTVLSTISVFVMDQNMIRFDLSGAVPSSYPDNPTMPALLIEDDEIITTALAVPHPLPAARINGMCNPEEEEGSWDRVKSLYH